MQSHERRQILDEVPIKAMVKIANIRLKLSWRFEPRSARLPKYDYNENNYLKKIRTWTKTNKQTELSTRKDMWLTPRHWPGLRGILPYMGHVGMCSPKGYGFSAISVINKVSILAILVRNRVWFLHSGFLFWVVFLKEVTFFVIVDKATNKSPS